MLGVSDSIILIVVYGKYLLFVYLLIIFKYKYICWIIYFFVINFDSMFLILYLLFEYIGY